MIPADQRERMKLVREIVAYADFLAKNGEWRQRLVEDDKDKRLSIGGYDNRAEEMFEFDRTGNAWETTWETSCHNGDPYDFKERQLLPEVATARLTGLRDSMQELALKAEVKLLEEERARRLKATALSNLRAKVLGEIPKRRR